MVEHLLSICKVLGSLPSPKKRSAIKHHEKARAAIRMNTGFQSDSLETVCVWGGFQKWGPVSGPKVTRVAVLEESSHGTPEFQGGSEDKVLQDEA